jgi:hypothetical protein
METLLSFRRSISCCSWSTGGSCPCTRVEKVTALDYLLISSLEFRCRLPSGHWTDSQYLQYLRWFAFLLRLFFPTLSLSERLSHPICRPTLNRWKLASAFKVVCRVEDFARRDYYSCSEWDVFFKHAEFVRVFQLLFAMCLFLLLIFQTFWFCCPPSRLVLFRLFSAQRARASCQWPAKTSFWPRYIALELIFE